MEVDGGRHRELVVEHDSNVVSDVDLDHRSGDGAVERPGSYGGAGRDFPVRELGREVEHLRAVGEDLRLQELVADALRVGAVLELCGVDADRLGHRRVHLIVHCGHLLRRHGAEVHVAHAGRGVAAAAAADRQLSLHAGLLMTGDRAVRGVATGLEAFQADGHRVARLQVFGVDVRALMLKLCTTVPALLTLRLPFRGAVMLAGVMRTR